MRASTAACISAAFLVGCDNGTCPAGETRCGGDCVPTITVTARGMVNSVFGISPEPDVLDNEKAPDDPAHYFSSRAATNRGAVEVQIYTGFGAEKDGRILGKTIAEKGGDGEWVIDDLDVTCVHRDLPLLAFFDDPEDSGEDNFAASSYFLWQFEAMGIPETGHILPPGGFPAFVVTNEVVSVLNEALGRVGSQRLDEGGATLVWMYDLESGPMPGLTLSSSEKDLRIEYPRVGYPTLPLRAAVRGIDTGPCGLAVITNPTGVPLGPFDISVTNSFVSFEDRSTFIPAGGRIQTELWVRERIK